MAHRIKDTNDLKEVLAKGENESLQFKVTVPPPEIIARHIAALSNTSGGTVLIGVNDDGSIVGSDIQSVRKALERAQANLTPEPATEVYDVPYQNKRIVAIDVQPSSTGPVLSGGNVVMRVGPRVAPITPLKTKNKGQVL